MVLQPDIEDREFDKFGVDGSGLTAVRTLLTVGDIQIGAVEIKDGTTDQRAIVDASGALKVTLSPTVGQTTINVYGDASISPGSEITVATYTVPVGRTFYYTGFIVGGKNTGRFRPQVNSSTVASVRNSAASPSLTAQFWNVISVSAGGTVDILVLNEDYKNTSLFEATINGYII